MRRLLLLSATMRVLLFVTPSIWAWSLGAQSVATPLRFPIAVSIHDSAASGVVTSAIRSALRKLGDVDIVEKREHPRFLIWGAVNCIPADCRNALSYSVVLVFSEPLRATDIEVLLGDLKLAVPPDTAIERAMASYSSMERVLEFWNGTWGGGQVGAATTKLVASIDTRCLEKLRTADRLLQKRDSASSAAFTDLFLSTQWIC